MKTKSVALVASLLSAVVLLNGCTESGKPAQNAVDGSSSAPAATGATSTPAVLKEIAIEEIGPAKTKAGVDFNVQPDGMSAIWVRVNQNLEGQDAAVWIDGVRLGNPGITKQTVTGSVPKQIYAAAGTHQVEVKIGPNGDGAASNKSTFVVE